MKKAGEERNRIIAVRLTPEEFARLMQEAETMHLALSSYVRHRLFSEVASQRPVRRRG